MPNLWSNPREIPNNGIDEDLNGGGPRHVAGATGATAATGQWLLLARSMIMRGVAHTCRTVVAVTYWVRRHRCSFYPRRLSTADMVLIIVFLFDFVV